MSDEIFYYKTRNKIIPISFVIKDIQSFIEYINFDTVIRLIKNNKPY
jgi:hypothetical protein